jgi:hypothetical protein
MDDNSLWNRHQLLEKKVTPFPLPYSSNRASNTHDSNRAEIKVGTKRRGKHHGGHKQYVEKALTTPATYMLD